MTRGTGIGTEVPIIMQGIIHGKVTNEGKTIRGKTEIEATRVDEIAQDRDIRGKETIVEKEATRAMVEGIREIAEAIRARVEVTREIAEAIRAKAEIIRGIGEMIRATGEIGREKAE